MSLYLHRKENEGFTLLEVLIALSVLIFGIVAVMQLFPVSLLQARMAAERTISAELANSVMGEIRASGAAALFYSLIPAETLNAINRIYQSYAIYEGFTTSVQRMNGGADVFLQRVTFSVEFPEGRRENFVTYVAQR